MQDPPAYDPNLLFDELLRRFRLENDEALAQKFGIGRGMLWRIRRGDSTLSAALLIRISEHSSIGIAELRRIAGDRRAEFRLEDRSDATPATTPQQRSRRPQPGYRDHGNYGLIRDDPGLPANVQWA